MSNRSQAWLAIQHAHLPHYSHTAVTVGTVILLAIIVLEAVAMFAVAVSGRAEDSPPDEDGTS